MMKMTRKMAAMVAAMMAVSSIGAVNAFAVTLDSEHYKEGDTQKSADVTLKATVTNEKTQAVDSDTISSDYNDSEKHIWNVTIDATELNWNLTKTAKTTYQQKLTWNSETHQYEKARLDNETTNLSETVYSFAEPETAAKSVHVKNDSNFSVNSTFSVNPVEGAAKESIQTAETALFTIEGTETTIAVGDSINKEIVLHPENISGSFALSNEATTLGTAHIALEPTGDIVAYTSTPSEP